MDDPLLWNPLPDSAAWLAKKTGRTLDARWLVDLVISMGTQGDPTPTIIQAVLPRKMRFAKVGFGKREFTELQKLQAEQLTSAYGPLPPSCAYTGYAYPSLCPLPVIFLVELLLHGYTEVSIICGCDTEPNEDVWIMPFGTAHRVELSTCGLRRADLIALAERITNAANGQTTDSDTHQQKKITAQRRDAIISGLTVLGYMPAQLPKRQPGTEWVKAAFWRRHGGSGLFVSRRAFDKAWSELSVSGEIAETE